MTTFRGIFRKRGGAGQTGSKPATSATNSAEAAPRSDVTFDDSFLALSRELSGLKETQVSQAARERGWASLQRELERRPVRQLTASPAVKGPGVRSPQPAGSGRGTGSRSAGRSLGGRRNRLRWALGGVAATLAVAATLLGTLLGGGAPEFATGPTTVTSVATSDTSQPNTTITSTPDTGSSTSVTQPSTTEPNGSSTTGSPTTGSTGSTGTTGGHTGTTNGTTPSNSTSTTQPSSPSTTPETAYTSKQRIDSAEKAAAYLGQLVISGNTSGVGSLVAPSAQSNLAQMVRTLSKPYDYSVKNAAEQTGDVIRVTLAINDRVMNGQGELQEAVKSFFVQVLVDGGSATIVGIYAGS